MNIGTLKMEYGHSDKMTVQISANCYSPQDCDSLIEWLQLAKQNMAKWENIGGKTRAAIAKATTP